MLDWEGEWTLSTEWVTFSDLTQGGEDKTSPAKATKTDENESAPEAAAAESSSLEDLDFSSSAKTKAGEEWNTKLISMNVNGFRAWWKVCITHCILKLMLLNVLKLLFGDCILNSVSNFGMPICS